jgi:SPP1 family predicted phage head-tail adaptor
VTLIAGRTPIARKKDRGMFQNPGPAVPSGTGFVQSWIDLPPPAWAHIEPATATSLERSFAGTVLSTATHVVTIEYRTGISTKSRFVFDGRTANVLSVVDPDNRHVELVLACAEIVK